MNLELTKQPREEKQKWGTKDVLNVPQIYNTWGIKV